MPDVTSLNTVFTWFKKDLKPTEQQFYNAFFSFRHKLDKIEWTDLNTALQTILNGKADGSLLDNYFLKTDTYDRAAIDAIASGYKGIATTATDPLTPVGAWYTVGTAGTYTNFKDASNASIVVSSGDLTNNFVVFSVSGAVTTKTVIPLVTIVNDLVTNNPNQAISAAQGVVLKALIDLNSNSVTAITKGTFADVAGPTTTGYISKTTGALVVLGGWISTDFKPIEPHFIVRRVGPAFNTIFSTSAAALVAFYDASQAYLGHLLANITTDFSFVPKDYFPTAKFIRVTSTTSLELYIKPTILKAAVEGLTAIEAAGNANAAGLTALKTKLVKTVDLATIAKNGYYSTAGAIVSAGSWRYIEKIKTKPGEQFIYTGVTSSSVLAVVGWNDDFSVVTSILGNVAQSTQTVTIPAGVVWVAASSRMTGGDVFAFVADLVLNGLEEMPAFFMPKYAWARQGDNFRMNPFGIIAKHPSSKGVDLAWNLQQCNELFLNYTPGAEVSTDVILKVRSLTGELKEIGTTSVLITHTMQSPATAQNFIHFGDSTVDCVSSSAIQGAIINEVSRRLTGTGTALLTGSENPAALALTNLYFRGTRGNQPIKHEGYPGARINDFLIYDNIGGLANAFWNPTSSAFDLAYYLTQNGFDAGSTTGGVDSTGSNLTVIIQLGWNHVYSSTVSQAKTYMKQLIDSMRASKSAVKIKLIGLPCPPPLNQKAFSGSRNVSPESIMRDAMLPYSNAWQDIAEDVAYSSFVEFLPIAPFYFPDKSYPSQTIVKAARNSDTVEVYTDYVHANSRGYAQFADVIYYNLLYNYCKLT